MPLDSPRKEGLPRQYPPPVMLNYPLVPKFIETPEGGSSHSHQTGSKPFLVEIFQTGGMENSKLIQIDHSQGANYTLSTRFQ